MATEKSPWTIDAAKIDDGETDVSLIRNEALDRFLELSPGNYRSVLVAGKGQGKTLALLHKSKLYHNKKIPCLPTGNKLIERMPDFHLSGRDRDLIRSLTRKDTWSLV